MKNILKSYNIFTLVFIIAVVVTIIWTPIYGLGDLAEYTSTFEGVGLYNASSDTYAIAQNYGISEPNGTEKSPFQLFLTAIIAINKMLFSKTVFNIHFLSAVYSLMFIIGMYFLQKNLTFQKEYLNYVFSAFLGIVFLDLGYLAYFNSFYADGLIFAAVICIAALAVSVANKLSYPKIAVLTLLVCVLSLMKFSAAVLAFSMAIAVAIIGFAFYNKYKKIAVLSLSVVIALVSVFSMFNAHIPARDIKLYNLIYNDFAVEDEAAIEFFNVNKEKLPENATGKQMSEAVKNVNYTDVVRYYVSSPKQFAIHIKSAASNAYFLVQDYASYREAGAVYGFRENAPIKIWNFLKKRVLPNGVWVILAFVVIYFVIAIREFIKNRKNNYKNSVYAIFAAALPIGAISEMAATVITTGNILISKNMFVFGIYFDMMIITAVMWVAATLILRQEEIKNKYGVKQ